jgi:DGQHR domain-containing protein
MAYKITDSDHFLGFVNFCKDKLTNHEMQGWISSDYSIQAQKDIPELLDDIEEMQRVHNKNGTLPSSVEVGEIWERFTSMASEVTKPSWNEWLKDNVQLTDDEGKYIGYGNENNALVSSFLLSASSLIQHHYTSPSDLEPVKLRIRRLKQGQVSMYIGYATVAQIDAISMVPWLDPKIISERFGLKVLKKTMKKNEWQRVIDQKRIHAIRNFADAEDSYMFNPVILYADLNSEHISVVNPIDDGDEGEIQVDFTFLSKTPEGYWTDYIPIPKNQDTRPLWIIDGQHRIRGFGASSRGHKLPIPFVLMVAQPDVNPDTMQGMVAKVFTEINTLGKGLDDLHKIYLSYMFEMSGNSGVTDYSINESGQPTKNSRPNRRAYELALHMASEGDSALRNMIEFQKPYGKRRAHHLVVNSKNWVNSTSKYYISGIYQDLNSDDYDKEEMHNFFKAFEYNANNYDWPDNKRRWDPGVTKNKPFLQFEGPFLVLLDLFPEVIEHIITSEKVERPISIDKFMEYLSPIANVDWRSQDLQKSTLKGRHNNNIKHLKIWMMNTIKSGKSHGNVEQVMSKNIRSKIGMGLLSPPEAPIIHNKMETHEEHWPGLSDMIFECNLPIHGLSIDWIVGFETPSGAKFPFSIPKTSISKRENGQVSSLIITLDDITSQSYDVTKIYVKAITKNGISPSESKELTFPRPNSN